jgi:peptide/histidine transporter 3/4
LLATNTYLLAHITLRFKYALLILLHFLLLYLLYIHANCLFIYFYEGMNMDHGCPQLKKGGEEICLADSATTHTILRDRKYFSNLISTRANVTTISGPADLIEGSGRAHIRLPNGTQLFIQEALYSRSSRRNLLSFKDIRLNGYHIETTNENNVEYLCITSNANSQRRILERLVALTFGLYHTTIKSVEAYHVMNQKFTD